MVIPPFHVFRMMMATTKKVTTEQRRTHAQCKYRNPARSLSTQKARDSQGNAERTGRKQKYDPEKGALNSIEIIPHLRGHPNI